MLAWMMARGAILFACAIAASAADLGVTVRSGATPIEGATVTLYLAGRNSGAAAMTLGSGVSGSSGKARIEYSPPGSSDLLYVLADGGSSTAVRLAAVPGAGAPPDVVVNELTTVATAFAMSQFLKAGTIAGHPESLAAAAATARDLVDPATGEAAQTLSRNMIAKLHTLSNLLAFCVQAKERDACRDLFGESKA